MKLHWSPRSPFVRKVMITLHETGQLDQVELMRNVVAAHLPPNEAVLKDNPLGKIPALVTGEGVLFDSRVICEFLDERANGGLLPPGAARYDALRWQALADGATDLLLAWRTELLRPQGAWQAITDGYRIKLSTTLKALDVEAAGLRQAPFGLGHIAVICLLGQLDFRWSDTNWRAPFSELAALEVEWATRPSIIATAIVNDNSDPTDVAVTAGILSFDKEAK